MRRSWIVRIAVSLAVLSASCAKERPDGTGGGERRLRITPQIYSFSPSQERSAADSRAIVEGTAFANGSEAGYVVLGSADAYRNAGRPHLSGYGNVRAQATATAGTWLYYINHTQYVGTSLPGFTSYGNVDIYGYYPYNADLNENNLHAIPYSLGTVSEGGFVSTAAERTEVDYMYAEPVLNYTMRAGQSAQMTFRHVMTCLEFLIRKQFAGPALTLSTIDFTIEGNGRTFAVSGTFDAADGSVVRGSSATRILVEYNKTLGNTSVGSSAVLSCSLILPSLDCSDVGDDATITAVFHFTDQDGGEWEFRDGDDATYTFKLSDVADAQGNKGLRAGKRYQVNVQVSNFVKYSGMPTVVYPDWDTDKKDENPNII